MSVNWIAPVDITPGSVGWVDTDVSAYVPAGTTGIMLNLINDDTVARRIGVQNNGSTDYRNDWWEAGVHDCQAIGVDINRIFYN